MLILFDYDGVIVDSFDPLLDLCVEAQRRVGCGRAPTADDFRTIENLTFEDLGRLIGIPEQNVTTYCGHVFDLQKTAWESQPFPGVVPVLSQLAALHTLIVITSSQSAAVAGALAGFGLGDAVLSVMGGESGTSKAERIEVARAAHSVERQETFMVGDAISDVRSGKQAGVRTIAVTWGFQDRELLSKEKPDFLAESPGDLLTIASYGHVTRSGGNNMRGDATG